MFNQQQPLLFTDLDTCSLSEFFALYSRKSGVSLQSLNSLKFEVVLSGQDAIIVQKGGDEQKWRSLKQDITELVALATLKRPEEIKYEVWVDHCKWGAV